MENCEERYHLASGKKFPLKTWDGYCQDIGISKRTANLWLNVFELGWEAVLLSGSKEWFTPKEYIESILKVLGEIDLDPAKIVFLSVFWYSVTHLNKEVGYGMGLVAMGKHSKYRIFCFICSSNVN